MTIQEFSTEFDVLYNNITSNQAPGLNEYEKSVFLTKAQSQLLNEYFNNRTDGVGGGFDGSQRRQYDFSSLIKTYETAVSEPHNVILIDGRSQIVTYPSGYFLSVNEILRDDDSQYSVIPISYSEYQAAMLKPYAFPVKKAVWRLFTSPLNGAVTAELIGKFNIFKAKFYLRYIERPNPIILDDLANYGTSLSIDGKQTKSLKCDLPEETHQEILERAVTLAKIAWQGGTITQAASQQRNSN